MEDELTEPYEEELKRVEESIFMENMKDYIDWPYLKQLEDKRQSLKDAIAKRSEQRR